MRQAGSWLFNEHLRTRSFGGFERPGTLLFTTEVPVAVWPANVEQTGTTSGKVLPPQGRVWRTTIRKGPTRMA
jgi:hypothetical protein